MAIQYIKNPTEEIQLEAIKHDGFAAQYIKNPIEEMKLLDSDKYMEDLTKIQLKAIKSVENFAKNSKILIKNNFLN